MHDNSLANVAQPGPQGSNEDSNDSAETIVPAGIWDCYPVIRRDPLAPLPFQ